MADRGQKMDLNKLCNEATDIAVERGQFQCDGNDVFRALKHCAGEVIEANDAYNDWSYATDDKSSFENELADIIICVLSICGMENIDIEKAIERKMKINKERAK